MNLMQLPCSTKQGTGIRLPPSTSIHQSADRPLVFPFIWVQPPIDSFPPVDPNLASSRAGSTFFHLSSLKHAVVFQSRIATTLACVPMHTKIVVTFPGLLSNLLLHAFTLCNTRSRVGNRQCCGEMDRFFGSRTSRCAGGMGARCGISTCCDEVE